jgi:hypothetical protein
VNDYATRGYSCTFISPSGFVSRSNGLCSNGEHFLHYYDLEMRFLLRISSSVKCSLNTVTITDFLPKWGFIHLLFLNPSSSTTSRQYNSKVVYGYMVSTKSWEALNDSGCVDGSQVLNVRIPSTRRNFIYNKSCANFIPVSQ